MVAGPFRLFREVPAGMSKMRAFCDFARTSKPAERAIPER
jgi:hypothetical protein